MKQATVRTIHELIDRLAPFDSQEAFDNCGLLVGSMSQAVSGVLIALDATPEVLLEARSLGVQLLITHHPLMFRPIKTLLQDDFEGALLGDIIRSNISLLSAHTNLDQSNINAGMLLLETLNCTDRTPAGPYVSIGTLPLAMRADMLGRKLSALLGMPARLYGKQEAFIARLGIAGGAYDEGWQEAMNAGAQAYLTGEVRHHNMLAAVHSGFVLYDGGHFQTEAVMVPALCRYLQKELNALQYSVEVYASGVATPLGAYALKEEE